MMQHTIGCVNKNYPIFCLGHDFSPQVQVNQETSVKLPDNNFGRWWLATRYPEAIYSKQAELWLAVNDPFKFKLSQYLNNQPRSYQQLGVYRMCISNCGLWFDMGLGKSYTSIAFCLHLAQRGFGNTFLILCPTSVFVTWQDEIALHIKDELSTRTVLAHGSDRKQVLSKFRLSQPAAVNFIITSYETLDAILEDIKELKISAIFADESQKIKNISTIRTQTAFKLKTLFPSARRFCLSGTPSTTKVTGYYSQLEWLEDSFSGSPNYHTFENKYVCNATYTKAKLMNGRFIHIKGETSEERQDWLVNNYPPGENTSYFNQGYYLTRLTKNDPKALKIHNVYKRIFGFKNLDSLKVIMQTHSYTVKKEEVAKELPEKIYTKRYVEMSSEQKKFYKEMFDTNKGELENTTIRFDTQSSPHAKLHQIANGFIYLPDGTAKFFSTQPKIELIEDILEELPDEKLVIWSPHRAQIAQVAKQLEILKVPCVQLHGDIPVKDRPEIIHSFQNPEGARIFIGNPSVAGMGINLSVAHTQVFMSNWYMPDIRSQAENRLHRIGQKSTVTIIDLVCKGTLEPRILSLAQKRIETENTLIKLSDLLETKTEKKHD